MSEEEKCRRFEDDLNDHIRAHVTGFFHDDFSKIVTYALNVERVKKEEKERKDKRQRKKNPGLSRSQQRQRKRFRGPQGSSQPTAQATGRNATLPAPSVASAQEVLLEDRLLLIAPIMGKIIKENVGDL